MNRSFAAAVLASICGCQGSLSAVGGRLDGGHDLQPRPDASDPLEGGPVEIDAGPDAIPDADVLDTSVPMIDSGRPGQDSGMRDAGTRDAGIIIPEEDAGRPSTRVPMFVAVGWGGRRITSCDLGRTWIGDQEVVHVTDPYADSVWHGSHTPKGLAYANGTFVFLTGWGSNSVAHVSTNGIDWTSGTRDTTYGGVGFDDGVFVLVGNRHIATSNDSAASWDIRSDLPASSVDRDAAAFEGIWAAGADDIVETRRPGEVWRRLSSCAGRRHTSIGIQGGFAAGGGRLLSVGDDGNTCAIDIATGADRGAGNIGTSIPGKPAWVGDAFWVATGDAIHRSTDGITWTRRSLPSGVRFELVARADSGTYVGVSQDGAHFYYSDDGNRWTAATAPSGNGLVRVIFGYGSPSRDCPGG